MKTFHLTVARVGENLFDAEARSATFPGVEGVFELLPEHEAFVSELSPGSIRITDAAETEHRVEVSAHGVLEVSNNHAIVLL